MTRRNADDIQSRALGHRTQQDSSNREQPCEPVESITTQMQNARLYVPQAYLLQQQQQQRLQLEFQFLQQQRNGGATHAFAAASPYLDLPMSTTSTTIPSDERCQFGGGGAVRNLPPSDMDMIGMLPTTWSPRSSAAASSRWSYAQNTTNNSLLLGQLDTKTELSASPEMLFPSMNLPSSMNGPGGINNISNDKTAPERFVQGGSSQLFDKADGISMSYQGADIPMYASTSMGSASNQFAVDQEEADAIFQPVTDATNLEPLDDTSLELLVSSLTHINSDLNQYTDDCESFSDSSTSSISPDGSPHDRSPTAVSQSASAASLEAGAPKKKPKRIRRLCTQPDCGKRARSQGLCIAHGGGRRCVVDGCEKSSQGGNMCIKHGGGKRCRVSGCNKAAQTNSLCKGHGGGPRCQVNGCDKSSQGGGFCRSHGGGKRCAADGCDKGTQRGDFCALHGGSRFCEVTGCRRNDRGGGLCAHHGGGKRCDIMSCTRPSRRNGFCSTHLRLLGKETGGGEDSDEGKSWA